MSITFLPTFKGYTVDLRLSEFRRAFLDTSPEFIPFNSPQGKELLDELKIFAVQVIDIRPDEC